MRDLMSGALAVLVLFLVTSSALAGTVIDFESLSPPEGSYRYVGPTYTEDGFLFVNANNTTAEDAFASIGVGEYRYPGSTAFLNLHSGGITRLTSTAALPFDLNSIDLSEFDSSTTADVQFEGFFANGTSVVQRFSLDGLRPTGDWFETFTFIGFKDVVRVEWTQAYPFHQFDNITINSTSGSTVPLPSAAWAGLGLLGLLGAARRYRRRKAA